MVLDSTGGGSAGCLLAVELGINQIEENSSVDILRILARLREDRGGIMASPNQYVGGYPLTALQMKNLNDASFVCVHSGMYLFTLL